jgi:hypothetical protein
MPREMESVIGRLLMWNILKYSSFLSDYEVDISFAMHASLSALS